MRPQRYKLSTQKRSLDYPLLLAVAFLIIFGLIMVYNSSVIQAIKDFDDSDYYIRQQIVWVVIGILSAIFFTFFDYNKFKKLSLPMLLVSIVLLLLVLVPGLGVTAGGAHRWLNLGFATIQPAEIIKLTGVLYLATVFEKKARILPIILLTGLIIFIMAVLQRDLGSTIVYVITSATVYFIAGGSILQFVIIIPVTFLAFAYLALSSEYRRKRILAFLDPFSDPQGFTYHISQVLIALGSGGLFGLGLGQSRQKFEYIPEVSTDSIFAIIGEELGFIGGLLLIISFAFFAVRGFRIAERSNDSFGRILASGLTSWIVIQAIVNLSSMVALMPLTGVPLPFISYGGSALVMNLTAVGILLNISKNN